MIMPSSLLNNFHKCRQKNHFLLALQAQQLVIADNIASYETQQHNHQSLKKEER